MAQGIGNIGSAAAAAAQGASSAEVTTSSGSTRKDPTESSTEPKFGEVLKKLQSQFGAKAEKPREIKKTLGKDDFLRIMITQMQHQDPTNPFKAEQMAAEMAQFTSVEQMQNMNRSLEKMTTKDQPLERLAMTNLIGKTVTVDRGRFPHQQGNNESLAYDLPKNASSVKIAIIGENGEVALEKDLGPQKAGGGSYSWDGVKSNTLPAKTGNYILRVEAKDERGQSMETGAQSKARVIGVSFEGTEPVLLIGDAKNQARVTLSNVIRIDDAGMIGAPSHASAGAGGGIETTSPGGTESKKPNFIAFQKGVGSSNLDPNQLPPEASEALKRFEADSGAGAKESSHPAVPPQAGEQAKLAAKSAKKMADSGSKNNEMGFPNGLHD